MIIVICFSCKRPINKNFAKTAELETTAYGMEGMFAQMLSMIKDQRGYDDVLDKIKAMSSVSQTPNEVYLCLACHDEILNKPDPFPIMPFVGLPDIE